MTGAELKLIFETMNAMFKIHKMNTEGSRTYVHGSLVKRQSFVVSSGSTLGSFPLKNELWQTGAESFAFRLDNPKDSDQLKAGQIVGLTP